MIPSSLKILQNDAPLIKVSFRNQEHKIIGLSGWSD